MGAFCPKELDLQPLLTTVRDTERLTEGLRTQFNELNNQKMRFERLSKAKKEFIGDGFEEKLREIKTECEDLEEKLRKIKEELSGKSRNLKEILGNLAIFGEYLRNIHDSLRITRKNLKTAAQKALEMENSSRFLQLERKISEQEAELQQFRSQKPNFQLTPLELTRKYSDLSDYSEGAVEEVGDLGRLGMYNQKLLKEKILLMFCSQLHMNMVRAVHRWKNSASPRHLYSACSSPAADSSFEDPRAYLDSPRPGFPSPDLDHNRPMSRVTTVQLFENVMDDFNDQISGKKIKLPGEFLVEYLNRKHGLASLAMTKLTQFAMGVTRLIHAGSEYAKVISGVFGLGRNDEMHPTLARFIPYCRAMFLSHKDKKRPSERHRTAFPASAKDPPQRKSDLESGGTAPLVSVCSLIYQLCRAHPACGEYLLQSIRPSSVSVSDFVILKICQKMAQEGCSPEDLFRRFDKDEGGTIDCDEFEEGLRCMMGKWVRQGELQEAMRKIADGRPEVTRSDFFSAINFDVYFHGETGKNVQINCSAFLSAVVKLYESIVQETKEVFMTTCSGTEISGSELETAVRKLDPGNCDLGGILTGKPGGKLDLEGFLSVCQSEYVGSFRVFCMRYAGIPKQETSETQVRRDSDVRRDKRRSTPYYP